MREDPAMPHPRKTAYGILLIAPALVLGLLSAAAAGELRISVRDEKGEPVGEAVLSAIPAGAPPKLQGPPPVAVVDQVDKEYVPRVKAIQVGTSVSFPNKDDIRHHVYSFSDAKKFELPLYKGTPSDPVLFDKPGVVIIGCNIHDWMLGYIYVFETPWFAVTDAQGGAVLAGLPAGDYEIAAHHPDAKKTAEETRRTVTIGQGSQELMTIQIELKKSLRRSRSPRAGAKGYR